MITERDLSEAIAECQGERNPNASTCIKLAAFYTIKRELYGHEPTYSHAAAPAEPADTRTRYNSGTEFSRTISGRDMSEVLPVIDELVEAVRVLMPRLYDGLMRKLR